MALETYLTPAVILALIGLGTPVVKSIAGSIEKNLLASKDEILDRINTKDKKDDARFDKLEEGQAHITDRVSDLEKYKERVEGRFEGLGVVRESIPPLFSKVDKQNG